MQLTEFKRQGILYYLHKFLYKYDAKDTCEYRAQLIISFIVIIVTIHASLLRSMLFMFKQLRQDDEYWGIKNHILFTILSILFFVVGGSIIKENPSYFNFIISENTPFIILSFIAVLLGFITILLILGIIALVISIVYYGYIGISYILRKITIKTNFHPFKGIENSQAGVLYDSWKERWCKRIYWK